MYRVITLQMGITFLDNLICWALGHGGSTINGPFDFQYLHAAMKCPPCVSLFTEIAENFQNRKSSLHEKQTNKDIILICHLDS